MAGESEQDLFDWGGVPLLALSFGDAGIGKTTDMAFMMPEALFLTSSASNVRSAAAVLGVEFDARQIQETPDLQTCFAVLGEVHAWQQREGEKLYTGVGIDDISIMAANQLERMRASGDYDIPKKPGNYDRRIWVDLGAMVNDLLGLIRYDLDLMVGITAHAKPSEDVDGVFFKGGPDMPYRKLIRTIPHQADVSYRCSIDSTYKGEHKGVYDATQPSYDWHTKCRLGWNGMLPMNIAECIRNAPISYPMPRHPTVAWIEPWVKGVHAALMEGKSGVAEALEAKLAVKHPNAAKQHQDWIMRDAIARTILVKKRQGGTLASRWGV